MHLSLLPALREMLAMLPVDWILWALDATGKVLVYEGPGLRHQGVAPGERVGMQAREVAPENAEGVAFVDEVLAGPAARWLTVRGVRFYVQGRPMPEGGAVGLSLPDVAPRADAEDRGAPPVLEVARPIPELGAEAGDLLVFDPETPAYAGLFRRLWIGELPPELLTELTRVSRERAAAPGSPPPPGRDPEARPARPSHLRLLP